jgi:hypothetical protein
MALAAAAVGILLTGIWFRMEKLDCTPGLNGDEAWSGVQAMRFLQGESVAWRTPTGNPLNVFFWGPLVALHAVFSPSMTALRAVSVISGLLAIGLNYYLCRRTFNKNTAMVSTVLLTVLPATIAYSRFAWDASQTPLASVLVIYASLAARRSISVVCIALAAAIVVHPTNLFLIPIAFALMAPIERIRIGRWLAAASVTIVATILFAIRGPNEWGEFLFHLLRLFSGSTVYQFISGGVKGGEITAADLTTLAAIVAAFAGEAQRLRHAPDPRDFRLVLGTAASLVAFFAIAGPCGVQPHQERYAIWCIVPLVLIASRGAAWWLDKNGSHKKFVRSAMLVYAALLTASFQFRYFDVFSRTGGKSHLAFRTADVDPKRAALTKIQSESGEASSSRVGFRTAEVRPLAERKATIVSRNWWTRLPLQYLAAGNAEFQVVDALPHGVDPSTTWFVELAGSDDAVRLSRSMAAEPTSHLRSVCTDRAGRVVVVVYAPRIKADDSLKIFARPQFDNGAN